MEIGSFYVVPTPIGNLKDITLRALEVLKNVDYIACEDTRVTKKLLERYEIKANLFDYHKFNEKQCSDKIIEYLKNGKSLALVSDAGTPGISDPGRVLYSELFLEDIKINLLPGACAVSTFLSGLPRNDEYFSFVGFLPKTKTQQEELFQKYKFQNTVFYESPNRLLETLNQIKNTLGEDTKIAVGRELTKVYEEVKIGSISEVIDYFSENILKGEIVAMIYAKSCEQIEEIELLEKAKLLKKQGFSDKDASKILSALFNVNKNKVYKLLLAHE